MYEYEAEVINVVDGDTIDCTVYLGFHNTTKQRFRLLQIDAPEMKGIERPFGVISKEYLTKRLLGSKVILKSYADSEISKDSFGRWLAVVYIKDETGELIDINDEMIKLGYAAPYKK